MDNLDSLTNDELRLRLLECGFANMPVTINTRKLLVKKLRNHLENEKSKLRRETIHVTKYSSDEDSSDIDSGRKKSTTTTTTTTTSKTSRRATIGSGLQPAPNSTSTTITSKSNVRRSGRITPLAESVLKENNASVSPTVPDILEDTDEEIVVTKPTNTRRSKSKTPVTLSITEPVTISVRHIKPTLENIVERDIIINDESEEEFMSPPPPRSPVKPLPQKFSPKKDYSSVISSSSSSTTTRKKTLFGPEDDDLNFSSHINIPLSQSTKIYESNFLNSRNKPTSGVGSFQPRHSISTSYNNRYNSSTTSSGPAKFGSNEFGYSGITSTTYAKPKTYSQEEEEEYDDDYEEPVIEEKKLEKEVLNSPYLSKFAKRLSELRVDPLLPQGNEPQTNSKIYYTQTEVEPPRNIGRYSTKSKPTSTPVYQRSNIISRKSINSYKKDDKNSFFGQLRYEWNELNIKYKINRNLAILFILLVIIFIVVLLFF